MSVRKRQCPNCPWKKSTTAIPGGSSEKWEELVTGFEVSGRTFGGPLRAMQCHDSEDEDPQYCAGWVVNQLGPGNNLQLRVMALDGRFDDVRTVGPQRATLHGLTFAANESEEVT